MIKKRNNQKGLTLLEYCAGAAIIGLVVWVVLHNMGDHFASTGEKVGAWADAQADNLPAGAVVQGGGQGEEK